MDYIKREYKQEKWYSFERYYFWKGGWIDVWRGDMADDPRRNHENKWKFNAEHSFLRCNDGEWVKAHNKSLHNFLQFANEFSAQEIWDNTTGEAVHVYPVDDRGSHTLSGDHCQCNPIIEIEEGRMLVIHNSFDGRELTENIDDNKN